MKYLFISLPLVLLSTNIHANSFIEKLTLKVRNEINRNFSKKILLLDKNTYLKRHVVQDNDLIFQWYSRTRVFKCGFTHSVYEQLVGKQYIFHSPIKVEKWIPINGKPTSNIYWQVSLLD